MPLSEQAEQLIIAARAVPDLDRDYPPTVKQLQKLAIQMGRALIDKKHRKEVLQAIRGLPIESMKQLGGRQISVLIDLSTEEARHDSLYKEIEIALEDAPMGHAWTFFSSVWESANLSPVPATD